jgi:RHS repeat-associated protein
MLAEDIFDRTTALRPEAPSRGGPSADFGDGAGNMTSDGLCSCTYSAENQQTTAGSVTYTYDGDGRRVKKSSGTLYFYGLNGEVLRENNFGDSSATEYIYFGGKRLARWDSASGIKLYFQDHLGSSRVLTDLTGNRCCDGDFGPYGKEVAYITVCTQNYKFTGKERDVETGNDYFGARYYRYSVGRFISVDPVAMSSAKMADPQRLNMYTYARNNPLKYIDPVGEELNLAQLSVEQRRRLIAKLQVQTGLRLKYNSKSGLLEITGQLKGGSETFRAGLSALINDKRTFNVISRSEYSSNGQTARVDFGLYDSKAQNVVIDFRDFSSSRPEIDLGLVFYHEAVAHGELGLPDEASSENPFERTAVGATARVGRELDIAYPASHTPIQVGDRYYIRVVTPMATTTGGRIMQLFFGRAKDVDITDVVNQR